MVTMIFVFTIAICVIGAGSVSTPPTASIQSPVPLPNEMDVPLFPPDQPSSLRSPYSFLETVVNYNISTDNSTVSKDSDKSFKNANGHDSAVDRKFVNIGDVLRPQSPCDDKSILDGSFKGFAPSFPCVKSHFDSHSNLFPEYPLSVSPPGKNGISAFLSVPVYRHLTSDPAGSFVFSHLTDDVRFKTTGKDQGLPQFGSYSYSTPHGVFVTVKQNYPVYNFYQVPQHLKSHSAYRPTGRNVFPLPYRTSWRVPNKSGFKAYVVTNYPQSYVSKNYNIPMPGGPAPMV